VNLPRHVRAQGWELERLLAGHEHGGLALSGQLDGSAGDAVAPAIEAAPATDAEAFEVALCDPARALSGPLDGAAGDAVAPTIEAASATDADASDVALCDPARALSGPLNGAAGDAVAPAIEAAPATDAEATEAALCAPASCHEEHEGYVGRASRLVRRTHA
jgi:hypothetical protein